MATVRRRYARGRNEKPGDFERQRNRDEVGIGENAVAGRRQAEIDSAAIAFRRDGTVG